MIDQTVSQRSATPIPGSTVARSVRQNIAWTLAGNILYAAFQWGMLAAIAKLGDVEMVGTLALALATTTPIFVMAGLQLRVLQVTDVRQSFEFGDYLSLRLTMTALGLLVTAVFIGVTTYGAATDVVIGLVSIGKAFDAVNDVCYGLFQRHERFDITAKALVASGAISFALLVFGVLAIDSLVVGVVGLVVGPAVVLLAWNLRGVSAMEGVGLIDLVIRSVERKRLRPLARLARQSIPVTLAMTISAVNVAVPRYALEHRGGLGEVGIYSAIANLMVIGGTLALAVGQPLSPRLSQYYAEGMTDRFRDTLRMPLLLAVIGGLLAAGIALVAGRPLLTVVYTADYSHHAGAFAVLMTAMGIQAGVSILGISTSATRSFTVQLVIQAVALMVTITLSLILIGRWGINGAALAVLAHAMVCLIGYGLVVHRRTDARRIHRKDGHSLGLETA